MEKLQLFDGDLNMLDESIERDKKKEVPAGKYFMIILLFIENNEGKFRKSHIGPYELVKTKK